MSSSSTPSYLHTPTPNVAAPGHHRTTSRCETALRELLAKDANRLACRPSVSTERTRHTNDSVKHWIAHSDSSPDSHRTLSTSSLARSKSLSSNPAHLAHTINVSHQPSVQTAPPPPSPAVLTAPTVPTVPAFSVHHTRPSKHFVHRLGHRHHHSLSSSSFHKPQPSYALPSRVSIDHTRPSPHHSTQQAQTTSTLDTQSLGVGRFHPSTHPPTPIQYAASAAIHPNLNTSSMNPHVPRRRSQSSTNTRECDLARSTLHHPRPRPLDAWMTDWTTAAESPDDESSPSSTPPTTASRNLSFTDSLPSVPPLERTFTPPCTPPSFNIQVANEVCRSIQGYVSFFEIEGLGRPPAEVEEERLERERLEKEQRAKRSWFAWLSNGVFRPSAPSPSGAYIQ